MTINREEMLALADEIAMNLKHGFDHCFSDDEARKIEAALRQAAELDHRTSGEEAISTGIVDAFNEADFAILYREVEDCGTTSMQEIYNVPTRYCRLIAYSLPDHQLVQLRDTLKAMLELADESDILPCPFCGKPPFVEPTGFHLGGRTIRCETDDCMGPHTTAACVNDAVVQWNRRSSQNGERERVIEECAKVAENTGYHVIPDVLSEEVGKIASAIRALKSEKGS